jgi:Holliday junction DNA helicase RuvA
MIAFLSGRLLEKSPVRVVLIAGGVGYEISINPSTSARLCREGEEASLFIFESAGMYGGSVSLYGFLTRDEMQIFTLFKSLKATGAKKALELLEKASKSLPDFRRAILDRDAKILKSLFGFTQKTADNLITGLKDKMGKIEVAGEERVTRSNGAQAATALSQALEALAALGYKPAECRAAVDAIRADIGHTEDVADIVRKALRQL